MLVGNKGNKAMIYRTIARVEPESVQRHLESLEETIRSLKNSNAMLRYALQKIVPGTITKKAMCAVAKQTLKVTGR